MRSYHYLLFALALVFCFHSVAAAARYPLVVRQDGSSSQRSQELSATAEESSRPSSTAAPRESSAISTDAEQSSTTKEAARSSSIPVTTTSITDASATATSNGASASSSAEADIKDPLPIHPKISPAMGLAGTIMLIWGTVYAVIGIKNNWLYVFSSAAYLTSLAVTVLIIYLMSPPVSDAVQGAFFVAAFLTGMIFGALALVFSDITDGLGCLLGGFCLSMWFLTLKEGGLITSTAGRAIFIGCFSLGGFALSWSHYTREYGLIGSISFAGATITMLGVDCLSRAGWKEFWLYLWDLNPDTFPLFTTTYPMTRGIKVELAGVVILTIFGIVSQLRLWRLIKARREKNAAQRLEREQDQQREEEELGRKIEDSFQRERAQWEATYGNKGLAESSVESYVTTPKTSTSIKEKIDFRSSVEMVPLPKDALARSASKQAAVTVSVLNEDDIQQIDYNGNPVASTTSAPSNAASVNDVNSGRPSLDIAGPRRMSRSISARSSLKPSSPPPPPVVVPLPFKVPDEEDAQTQASDNASLSAVPDMGEEELLDGRKAPKRLSSMSVTKRISTGRISLLNSESEEALMIPHIEDDRASSIAATLDEADNVSLPDLSPPHSPFDTNFDRRTTPISATDGPVDSENRTHNGSSAQEDDKADASAAPLEKEATAGAPFEFDFNGEKPAAVEEVASREAEYDSPSKEVVRQSLTISTDPKSGDSRTKRASAQTNRIRSDTVVSIVKEDSRKGDQSVSHGSDARTASSQSGQDESKAGSLAGALPGRLSKVAQSYRTNEWAKHLEAAEKPDVDEIEEPESPGVKLEHEHPTPVSEEIAQPLIVAKRNSNRMSNGSNFYQSGGVVQSDPRTFRNSQGELPLSRTPSVLAAGGVSRSGSQLQLRSARNSATQLPALVETSTNRLSSAPTPMPSNTLMGQREALVQNRVTSQSFIPHSASTNSLAAIADQDMTLAQRRRALQHQKPPSASQKWQKGGWTAPNQIQEFDSHQPKRTNTADSDHKREVLLAGWRESIRQDGAPMQTVSENEEQRRAALMNAKRQKEMQKQQQAAAVQQRDSMMNNMMRSNEMLDAHREAMRRMQAAANKRA